jgi:hypothetical protein
MHVLQWIAVNDVEDKDHALAYVQDVLENMLTPDNGSTGFFDWFVAGGGRWNTQENDDMHEAYKEGKTNMVLSFEEEPDLFEERVLLSMEARKAEFDRYASELKSDVIDKIISNYNPREIDFSISMDMYPVKKVIDMAYGEWDFNSYFYDITNWSVTPKYMFETIDKGNKNWYLVPVDFHF